MPEFESRYFGAVAYQPDSVVQFPRGLPGFEDERRFLLIEQAVNKPVVFLQSLASAELCFITLPVSSIMAGLAAAGADWLVHQHPALESRSALQHWWLPALTAWAIGILLYGLPDNPIWWIGLIIGGITLTLVLVAEYITVDPNDIYHPLATAGLTALAFSLFLALSISLHAAGLRVFLLAPTMTITTTLVSLRVLLLRLHGRWAIVPALSVALVSGQFSAALHYWPLSSIRFGLMLTGIVYSLTGLVANMVENRSMRQTILEPTIICLVLWGAAIWMP